MPYRYYPGSIGKGRVTDKFEAAVEWAKNGHTVEFFIGKTVYGTLTWGEHGLVRKLAKMGGGNRNKYVTHECEVILVSFKDKRVISRRKVVTTTIVAA